MQQRLTIIPNRVFYGEKPCNQSHHHQGVCSKSAESSMMWKNCRVAARKHVGSSSVYLANLPLSYRECPVDSTEVCAHVCGCVGACVCACTCACQFETLFCVCVFIHLCACVRLCMCVCVSMRAPMHVNLKTFSVCVCA